MLNGKPDCRRTAVAIRKCEGSGKFARLMNRWRESFAAGPRYAARS
jgi:hypothetical protein